MSEDNLQTRRHLLSVCAGDMIFASNQTQIMVIVCLK